jgi:predicted nuclease of restriction endonuclease-like RecB superfamily
VLTADLVNARRRGAELHLVALDDDKRARAREIAAALLGVTVEHVGRPREDLDVALAAMDIGPREHRLRDGLKKLIEDRCVYDAANALDPEATRRLVFLRAAAVRSALSPHERFDRGALLTRIAAESGTSVDALESALFADLRAAHLLLSFDALSPEALVAFYEQAQAQAVLLRAVKVTVDVKAATSGALRAFFRRLKFLRLLYTIEKVDDAHRVVIDGPFSLFESISKYGLQLALVLPALEQCDAWKLIADVRWGKDRLPLVFRLSGGASTSKDAEPPLPDEVAMLLERFNALDTPWRASASTKILDLPGVGLCVPDLVFERSKKGAARARVYLEVMGYWSRAAVWKRVELVQAGLADHVIFAVGSRLRVSEEVLDGDLPSALYVYKGTMSARAIAERLDTLSARLHVVPSRRARD